MGNVPSLRGSPSPCPPTDSPPCAQTTGHRLCTPQLQPGAAARRGAALRQAAAGLHRPHWQVQGHRNVMSVGHLVRLKTLTKTLKTAQELMRWGNCNSTLAGRNHTWRQA
jgi:hypothetical protein